MILTNNNYEFKENELNLKTLGKRKKREIKHVKSFNRVTTKHKKKSNITKHIKIPQVPDDDFDYDERLVESFEHPGKKPLLYFQLLNANRTKTLLPENLLKNEIPQVPDDDFEDNGDSMSKENNPISEPPLKLPKSYR